jgi:hypothetical protein
MSANAQMKTPSFNVCPQQQVLQMQHLPHITYQLKNKL